MNLETAAPTQVVAYLRRRLPLPALMRPPLLERARAVSHDPHVSPRCVLIGIFEAPPRRLMCHVEFSACDHAKRGIVAPLEQISFGRSHPLTRIVAALHVHDRGTVR